MSDRPRRFGPRRPDAPVKECPGCRELLRAGQFTTLVVIGPGPDIEERAKARTGRAYNAVAIEAHWSCVTGELDDDDE